MILVNKSGIRYKKYKLWITETAIKIIAYNGKQGSQQSDIQTLRTLELLHETFEYGGLHRKYSNPTFG